MPGLRSSRVKMYDFQVVRRFAVAIVGMAVALCVVWGCAPQAQQWDLNPTVDYRVPAPNPYAPYSPAIDHSNDWRAQPEHPAAPLQGASLGVPADSHVRPLPFGGWTCDFGYQQDGSRCVPVVVPENAQLSYFGNSWECMHGFQQDGSRCVPVAVPEHGRLAYFGHSWECDPGFQEDGSQCIPVATPEHGHLAYFGHSWECDSGFQQDGTLCVQVPVPAHAHLNYFGHSWECDSGFQQEGISSCVVVSVPENGHLSYLGHSWECDSGFSSDGNSCVPAVASTTSPSPASYSNSTPLCAENGSCYGDISNITGLPKTVPVHGYFRSNGTYVRGYYRSR
jgi:hypothetical protein